MEDEEQSEQRIRPNTDPLNSSPETDDLAAEPPVVRSRKASGAQPFSEHVRELRRRLLYCLAALFLGSIAGYMMHEWLFRVIRRPLQEQLYYTTPLGGFNAVIKISILFGIVVAVPIFVYQLGKFLSPAFRRRSGVVKVVFFSAFLGILGVLFAYYLALPAALHFLANIDSENLQALITINEYLNFVGAYLVGFALLFQLPLILLFINRIKPLKPGRLMRAQRWVILGSFVIAAILTPTPDPMNQLIMTLPIVLLYQFSIMLVWYVNRREGSFKVEPAPAVAKPAPEASAPAPAGYSADTYGSRSPFPSALARTATAASVQDPRLIMDIYGAPQAPAI